MDVIAQARAAFIEAFEDLNLKATPEHVTRMWQVGREVAPEWPGTKAQHELALREAICMYMERFI